MSIRSRIHLTHPYHVSCFFLFLFRLSLIINRRTCCPTIIIATILFILAVVLNSYATAFTAQTLLRFV